MAWGWLLNWEAENFLILGRFYTSAGSTQRSNGIEAWRPCTSFCCGGSPDSCFAGHTGLPDRHIETSLISHPNYHSPFSGMHFPQDESQPLHLHECLGSLNTLGSSSKGWISVITYFVANGGVYCFVHSEKGVLKIAFQKTHWSPGSRSDFLGKSGSIPLPHRCSHTSSRMNFKEKSRLFFFFSFYIKWLSFGVLGWLFALCHWNEVPPEQEEAHLY